MCASILLCLTTYLPTIFLLSRASFNLSLEIDYGTLKPYRRIPIDMHTHTHTLTLRAFVFLALIIGSALC